jgi:hypothetical protein
MNYLINEFKTSGVVSSPSDDTHPYWRREIRGREGF